MRKANEASKGIKCMEQSANFLSEYRQLLCSNKFEAPIKYDAVTFFLPLMKKKAAAHFPYPMCHIERKIGVSNA